MKILFVQDHLQTGGAAKCALRMQKLCREIGHETVVLHGDKTSLAGTPSVVLHGKAGGLARLWENLLPGPSRLVARGKRALKRFQKFLDQNRFDLVWFHNLAGARKWGWSESWVGAALSHGKVILTLHDMEYLGVGGSYLWDRPLQPTRFAGLDPALARQMIRSGSLRLHACSRWLGRLCLDLYELPCGQLPVPLWPEDFQGRNRIPPARPGSRYLLAAEQLDDPRKNLLPTIRLLQENGILERTQSTLFCLGRNFPEQLRSPRVIPLGHVENRATYRKIYDQIDFLLHPSLLDNFPLLIQESLAQGCPVVALNRGGVGEMVVDGRSGRLLAEMNSETLGKTFLELSRLGEKEYALLSNQCRALAEEHFLATRIASRYRDFLEGDWHA